MYHFTRPGIEKASDEKRSDAFIKDKLYGLKLSSVAFYFKLIA